MCRPLPLSLSLSFSLARARFSLYSLRGRRRLLSVWRVRVLRSALSENKPSRFENQLRAKGGVKGGEILSFPHRFAHPGTIWPAPFRSLAPTHSRVRRFRRPSSASSVYESVCVRVPASGCACVRACVCVCPPRFCRHSAKRPPTSRGGRRSMSGEATTALFELINS